MYKCSCAPLFFIINFQSQHPTSEYSEKRRLAWTPDDRTKMKEMMKMLYCCLSIVVLFFFFSFYTKMNLQPEGYSWVTAPNKFENIPPCNFQIRRLLNESIKDAQVHSYSMKTIRWCPKTSNPHLLFILEQLPQRFLEKVITIKIKKVEVEIHLQSKLELYYIEYEIRRASFPIQWMGRRPVGDRWRNNSVHSNTLWWLEDAIDQSGNKWRIISGPIQV